MFSIELLMISLIRDYWLLRLYDFRISISNVDIACESKSDRYIKFRNTSIAHNIEKRWIQRYSRYVIWTLYVYQNVHLFNDLFEI